MSGQVTENYLNVDPAFVAALDSTLRTVELHLDEVQHFMRTTKSEHPEIQRGTMLNLVKENRRTRYLDDMDIEERRAMLRIARDKICDSMQKATTPKERALALIEIVQGGLHGSVFLGNDFEMWRIVDHWLEDARAEFLRTAPPTAMRAYKPALEACSRYAEMTEMAHGALREMIHAEQRKQGAAPHELRDTCYDWAEEHFYRHYPSRRDHELTMQEKYWITEKSKGLLEGLFEPYSEGLSGYIAPEMAAFIVLTADRHAQKLEPEARAQARAEALPAANDNTMVLAHEVLRRTNGTLSTLLEKHPDAALSAEGLLEAWNALDRQMAPAKAERHR